jgi:hypothetical protein
MYFAAASRASVIASLVAVSVPRKEIDSVSFIACRRAAGGRPSKAGTSGRKV